MNVVELDARHWKAPSDFYKALLRGLGAPDWHGDNIPALIDSMIVDDINEVRLPIARGRDGLGNGERSRF